MNHNSACRLSLKISPTAKSFVGTRCSTISNNRKLCRALLPCPPVGWEEHHQRRNRISPRHVPNRVDSKANQSNQGKVSAQSGFSGIGPECGATRDRGTPLQSALHVSPIVPARQKYGTATTQLSRIGVQSHCHRQSQVVRGC